MIRGHGIDIVEIERIRKIIDKYGQRFTEKFFTTVEIGGAGKLNDPVPYYAVRFAAKEAFSKAVGTGFRGFGLSDVGILREEGGPPRLEFSEVVKNLFPGISEGDFSVSLSHEKNYAVASVIWV
jgi:holo-[acyl-carrier protein] synthase